MARRKKVDARALKSALLRSNTTLLQMSVSILQFGAMLLLACKTNPVDTQALLMAFALPAATWGVVRLFSRLWPVDRALLLLTLLLVSVSLTTLKDIAKSSVTPGSQALYASAGIVAMACGILLTRYLRSWEKMAKVLSVLAFVLLCLPLVIGTWMYGAKNWIHLFGDVSMQPSEFVKPALVFILAASLTGRPRFRDCLPALGLAAAFCVVLLAERDLGALLIYFLTTVAMYYAATQNLPVTLAGLGAGAGGAVIAYRMFPYVAKRFEMFLNPWSDPLDSGWQIIQALIAIGSGGAFGTGLGLGYPRNIPLYHSDFIFAAISEEFGLIFSIGLLAVYVLIIMRGISVAMNARTGFHSLLAFGVVTMIGVQAFINIGGNVKMIPLTGVTLPFVSAGGSSLVSMMGMMGMLLGVSSINSNDEVHDLARLERRQATR